MKVSQYLLISWFWKSSRVIQKSAPDSIPPGNPYRAILRRDYPEPLIALLAFILGIWLWDHYFGKEQGYARFNLGMAPLASVGDQRGAHARERLARLLFQRGEQWYNFQGLRAYKDKFDPTWAPRYMAYQDAWEWPVAIAYVCALIAGGWGTILTPPRETATTSPGSVSSPEPVNA